MCFAISQQIKLVESHLDLDSKIDFQATKSQLLCDATLPNIQSSPGILQSGQQPSKAILHIPQFSSLAIQCQLATPVHLNKEYIISFKLGPVFQKLFSLTLD